VLDVLLDQEGVEIDLTEKRDGDTCLHKAVRYVNGLDKREWDGGAAVVEILLDAGCDPRYVRLEQGWDGLCVRDTRLTVADYGIKPS